MPYGNPVAKYIGLTSAGEIIRVGTRHVPSRACEDTRNATPREVARSAAGTPASCSATSASPVEYASDRYPAI